MNRPGRKDLVCGRLFSSPSMEPRSAVTTSTDLTSHVLCSFWLPWSLGLQSSAPVSQIGTGHSGDGLHSISLYLHSIWFHLVDISSIHAPDHFLPQASRHWTLVPAATITVCHSSPLPASSLWGLLPLCRPLRTSWYLPKTPSGLQEVTEVTCCLRSPPSFCEFSSQMDPVLQRCHYSHYTL